jgi:hypothetical protein
MNLRDVFPNARFSPPATEQRIAEVESALGVKLPEELREFYLECDGFREDRGNAKYLLSLIEEDYIGSLVTITKFLWQEFTVPNLRHFVFFGSSSGDECWGIRWRSPHEVIAYHHHMGDDPLAVEQRSGITMARVREIAEALLHPKDEIT